MAAVDRLSKLADMVIWVLDPQKYADAAVHNRYLIPLAGHAGVFAVVLNQLDLLSPQQARECGEDLRRLLDAEGLGDTPLLGVSARTGLGLLELRDLLMETVRRNRTAGMRIAADIDALVDGFAGYAGPQLAPDSVLIPAAGPLAAPLPESPAGPSLPPWELDEDETAEAIPAPKPSRPPWEEVAQDGDKREGADPAASVPRKPAEQLIGAFARAAGLTAVVQAMASGRDVQAARLTGWPAGRLLGGRARPGPRLARGRPGHRRPWPPTPRPARRSSPRWTTRSPRSPTRWAATSRRRGQARCAMPRGATRAWCRRRWRAPCTRWSPGKWSRSPAWWGLVTAWQWLLTVLAAVGIGLSVVIGVVRAAGGHQGWISEVSLIPWLLIMAAAMLALGYVTAVSCRNLAAATADREREAIEQAMRDQVAEVTHDLVLARDRPGDRPVRALPQGARGGGGPPLRDEPNGGR